MLGSRMNRYCLILCFLILLGCDSNDYQECYEPIFLNETSVDFSIFWGNSFDDAAITDSLVIKPGDTLYSIPGRELPFLYKDGLLYDIRLEFQTTPKKCLTYTGEDYHQHDIRDFSSYENLGPCNYCFMRGQSTPDGMLYRITDELLEQAGPCE